MRITKGSAGGVVVRLSPAETKTWEQTTEKATELSRRVRRAGEAFAAKHKRGGTIEVYAAARSGGWMADTWEIEAA